jgi:hypothetical protein
VQQGYVPYDLNLPRGVVPANVVPPPSSSTKRCLAPMTKKPYCPSPPIPGMKESVVEALEEIASKGRPLVTQQVPYETEGFRSTTIEQWTRVVCSPPGTTAQANAIAAAEVQGMGAPLTVLSGTSFLVQSFQIPAGVRWRFYEFMFNAKPWFGWYNATLRIDVSGAVAFGPQPLPYAPQQRPLRIFFEASQKDTVAVIVSLADIGSPYVIETRLGGYSYPVVNYDDSVQGTLVREDPARDASPIG